MFLAMFLLSCPALSVSAQDDSYDVETFDPHAWDIWSGYFATPDTSFGFGGVTYAPNGAKTRDGFRFRAQGGFGTYSYSQNRHDGSIGFSIEYLGQAAMVDGLIGYQMQIGEFTGKVFTGLTYQRHTITPNDPDNPVNGEKWGGKIAAEGWVNVGEASFAAFDVSYATPFSTYSGQVRYGQSVWDHLWIGVEVGGYGNAELDAARAGLFGRWQTDWGTLWLAGGISGDYADPQTPYGSLTYVTSF